MDRLIKVEKGEETTTYFYDSFHRRTAKKQKHQTTHYLYHGQNEIGAQVDNQIVQLRVLGLTRGAEIGAAIAIELNNIPYAPIHDSFGSIIALIDVKRLLAASYRYTAFGETIYVEDQLDNPWRYSSKRFDEETGFLYFCRRYYISDIGRWITPDQPGLLMDPKNGLKAAANVAIKEAGHVASVATKTLTQRVAKQATTQTTQKITQATEKHFLKSGLNATRTKPNLNLNQ